MKKYVHIDTGDVYDAFRIRKLQRIGKAVELFDDPADCRPTVIKSDAWALSNAAEVGAYIICPGEDDHFCLDAKTFEAWYDVLNSSSAPLVFDKALSDSGIRELHSDNKYHRRISSAIVTGEEITVDVYEVLLAFGVTCPATQHAIKKLLCGGLREKGSRLQDLQEAAAALHRAIDFEARV